ncbi:copper homeostasis protein CutC [soil metagenome]
MKSKDCGPKLNQVSYNFTFDGFHLTRPITFELCAETLEACLTAAPGGANRIELCSHLELEGLTPEDDLILSAVEQSALPVHAMLRPRGGDFCYSDSEFEQICEDLRRVKGMGIAGVVFGFLHEDNTVDTERTRLLVELASPLQTTFHRAFDATPNLSDALEAVIACGCDRVLTSGGAPDVLTGADSLAALVTQAGDRIAIAVGGGLRLATAGRVAEITGAHHFHASVRRSVGANRVPGTIADVEALTTALRGGSSAGG